MRKGDSFESQCFFKRDAPCQGRQRRDTMIPRCPPHGRLCVRQGVFIRCLRASEVAAAVSAPKEVVTWIP